MPKVFKTKDFYEASALIATGHILLSLQKDTKFYWFVFEDSGCVETCNLFWRNELMLHAKEYSDAIRTLKDRLFART